MILCRSYECDMQHMSEFGQIMDNQGTKATGKKWVQPYLSIPTIITGSALLVLKFLISKNQNFKD